MTTNSYKSGAFFIHPVVDVSIVAFFLHFVWEFWQAPWYAEMATMPHLEGILLCSQATFGDVVIALFGYAVVSTAAGDWFWMQNATFGRVSIYLSIGLLVTVVLELLATNVLDRWHYGSDMWVLPILGTALAPILQWLFIPLLSVYILRRLWTTRR